jgi:AcrR family transcriptional regulator
MSVQDVLDEVDASRGAFYHYFDSKVALLDAVVERMVDQATAAVEPIASDPSLSATARFQALFSGIARWKGERTDLLIGLLDAWLADENAIVREKFRRHVVDRMLPLLTAIVREGHTTGEFTVTSPDEWPAGRRPRPRGERPASTLRRAPGGPTGLEKSSGPWPPGERSADLRRRP